MNAPDVEIRAYERADRARVRHICFETGFMGEPVAWQWRDAESFADIFSGYYTDHEPESASVVTVDGVVSGYLLGCVDSTRATDIARVALHHIVRRGVAFRPGTAGVIWRTLGDASTDLARRRVRLADFEFADRRWPAHLHIDFLPEARRHGAGGRLVRAWLDSLRARNIPGCHLQTMAENTDAIAFFESVGFTRHRDPILAPGLRSRDGSRLHTQVMTHDL